METVLLGQGVWKEGRTTRDPGPWKAKSELESWRSLPPPDCRLIRLLPTGMPRAAQGTYWCTAGVREARPPKLAEMVLISICFRAGEPSALRWNM